MTGQPDWKRRALALWPDLGDALDDDDTIHALFRELLVRCQEAHRRGESGELDAIYDYAEWCLGQPEKDIGNAAGVAFYEHLADEPGSRDAIPKRLKPEVYREVRGLLRYRLGAEEFARLDGAYRERHLDAE